MNTTRKPVQISHEELQVAIRRFQQNGGIIQKLPDQKPLSHQAVGSMESMLQSSTKPDAAV
jgi:hypothetical protein